MGTHLPAVGLALGLALGLLACKAERQGDASARVDQDRDASSGAEELATPRSPAVYGCTLFRADGSARGGRPRGPAGPSDPRERCLVAEAKTVSLWFPRVDGRAELGELSATFDDQALAARRREVAEGTLIDIELPRASGTLKLESRSPTWAQTLELREIDARYLKLEQDVIAKVGEGQLDEALELLRASASALPPDERALARWLEIRLVHASGELDEALALIGHLSGPAAPSTRGAAELLAAHVSVYDRPDFNAAEAHIERAEGLSADDFRTRIHAIYHRGLLDHRVGKIDESLARFARAARLAGLVGDVDLVSSARIMEAVSLARLGRFDEAEALARAVELELATLADSKDARTARDIRYDLAWIGLLRREHDTEAPDPSATLTELLAEYEAEGLGRDVAALRLHLALAAIQGGEAERARAQLGQVERGQLSSVELVWFELIAVQVALAGGSLDAARPRLERAALLAELNEDRELAWRVTAARARVERAEGRAEAALQAYSEAGALADELALAVPGSVGRSMIVTAHSRVDAEHIELLLDTGERERALCVAASVRARHLRSLWARLRSPLSPGDQRAYQDLLSRYEERQQVIAGELADAWELTTAQLEQLRDRLAREGERADGLLVQATALLERTAPTWTCARLLPTSPGAALLTMAASADRTRWRFMLARGGGRAVELVELDADAPASALAGEALDALTDALADVESLTVIPISSFVGVELRRLLFERPALAKIRLRDSLGLGAQARARAHERPQVAAVVAGAEDLDAVEREAASVREALRARGWTLTPRWSPTAAQPTLLHYSGHGHHEGLAGWSSYLELPELGRVSAAKIVASQRAPALVVLGACSAGTTDETIIDGGMNLAAAFLLAGADLVIAPSGPVDDDTALALARELYAELDGRDGPDSEALVAALDRLQRAELELEPAREGPRSTLRWRAWTP